MRISDWSSDVCSSDLHEILAQHRQRTRLARAGEIGVGALEPALVGEDRKARGAARCIGRGVGGGIEILSDQSLGGACRSEEHTSELQSLMRISYAVFCLKKKKY